MALPRADRPHTPQLETAPMRQLILDLLPADPPSFDNFVTGGNAETLTGLAAWLAPDNREPAFFLWGSTAAGKTHLLHASGARYCDAKINPDLSGLDENSRFHAVDNVDALDAGGQIALFNLFNRLRAGGGRLLAAAGAAPDAGRSPSPRKPSSADSMIDLSVLKKRV